MIKTVHLLVLLGKKVMREHEDREERSQEKAQLGEHNSKR
jgi:hypothetical protein